MTAIAANPADCLRHWAHERPDHPFLVQPDTGRTWTWAQAHDEVARMAAALAALGLPRGSVVAITGRNTAHWVLADLAIEWAGMVSVGLYPKQATDTVRHILEHSEARCVFVGPMLEPAGVLAGIPDGLPRIRLPYAEVAPEALDWDALVAAHAPSSAPAPVADDALRTLVYTSGTTGKPKGVMLGFGAGRWCGEQAQKARPVLDEEMLFSYMPLAHIFERTSVEGVALVGGGTITFLDALEHFAQRLREVQPTRFCAVPLIWSRLQAGVLGKLPPGTDVAALPEPMKQAIRAGLGLSRCRFAVSGAAPLAPSLIDWFAQLGVPIYQGYGMTENSAYVCCNLPEADRPGSVGRAFPGVELAIGAGGEILTRHHGQMAGYYKEPAKTAETVDADGWLHTGDLGALDSDGFLFVTGRIKDQFKTAKGHFVMPVPLENALAASPELAHCCVIGSGLKGAVALLCLSDAARAKPQDEVNAALAATLAAINAGQGAQERIEGAVVLAAAGEAWSIDNGLLTPTLKIRRNAIEQRYSDAAAECLAMADRLLWL